MQSKQEFERSFCCLFDLKKQITKVFVIDFSLFFLPIIKKAREIYVVFGLLDII